MLATDVRVTCPQRISVKKEAAPAVVVAPAAVPSPLPLALLLGVLAHLLHRIDHHTATGLGYFFADCCLNGFTSSYLCSLGVAAVVVSATALSATLARSIAYRQK